MILQQVRAALFPSKAPEVSTQVVLVPTGQRVRLRSLQHKDGKLWRYFRMRDQHALQPVEPTMPIAWSAAHTRSAWINTFAYLEELFAKGEILPLAIEVDGLFAGQISIGAIQDSSDDYQFINDRPQPGAAAPCWVGYWLAPEYQGLGIATAACALICDYAFEVMGLRELSATTLPENIASQKVLEFSGFFRDYTYHPQLHINGSLKRHNFYTLAAGDYRTSCVQRLVMAGRIRRAQPVAGR